MSAPSWGDLGERVAWLAYHRYRAFRKRWRRWRVSRRKRHPLDRVFQGARDNAKMAMLGANPYMTVSTAGPAAGLQNAGYDYYRQQAYLLQNAVYDVANKQYHLAQNQVFNQEDAARIWQGLQNRGPLS